MNYGWFERFDPRIRFLCTLCLSVETALLSSLYALLPLAGVALILVSFAGISAKKLCRRLFAVNVFVLFLWLFAPWSTAGTPCLTWFFFHVTQEGINLSLLVTIKANTIVLFFTALLATMDTMTLGHALHSLRISQKLIFLILFAERSFHILAAEWKNLQEAAKIRIFAPSCSLRGYKIIAQLLAILLLKSIDHAKRTHEALLLRGFSGTFISQKEYVVQTRDIVASLIILSFIGIALVIQIASYQAD